MVVLRALFPLARALMLPTLRGTPPSQDQQRQQGWLPPGPHSGAGSRPPVPGRVWIYLGPDVNELSGTPQVPCPTWALLSPCVQWNHSLCTASRFQARFYEPEPLPHLSQALDLRAKVPEKREGWDLGPLGAGLTAPAPGHPAGCLPRGTLHLPKR